MIDAAEKIINKQFFVDNFQVNKSSGNVVGSTTQTGIQRLGVDVEQVIGIDKGALRIQPLVRPGWGRAGIAYGPYRRENGLAFAVFMLNGHNTSQTGHLMVSTTRRLGRWLLGHPADSLGKRVIAWGRNGDKRRSINQLQRWVFWNRQFRNGHRSMIDENLTVGWFTPEWQSEPFSGGNAFVMHALDSENGELWTQVGTSFLPAVHSVQNVPVYYLVVLREKGAAYYAASLPDVPGMASFPNLRPIGIDAFQTEPLVFAGIHQSVMGQIGFWVDSRVYSTQVHHLAAMNQWYGSAHAADRLSSSEPLINRIAEVGGAWQALIGIAQHLKNGMYLRPAAPTGLLHLVLKPGAGDARVGIVLRLSDEENFWWVEIVNGRFILNVTINGRSVQAATTETAPFTSGQAYAVQLLDDGQSMKLFCNGNLILSHVDKQLAEATGVGLFLEKNSNRICRDFEAHPRTIAIPNEIQFCEPWTPAASYSIITDSFSGTAADLHKHQTDTGGKVWEKSIGTGQIRLTGQKQVRVVASAQSPNPSRTAYTVAWNNPDYVDMEVEITPPGTGRGSWEKGRGGLILWQDADNYIIVNNWLDDFYAGASVSSFFRLNGYEDLYDAVWTNVGKRIQWGQPYRLRLVSDGVNYLAYVNQEPVLYRSIHDVYPEFSRLSIHRVGIVANWEWGHDTGSTFAHFSARDSR